MASQTDKGKMAESVYISAGCNRYSNVADVRQDGLVAYGAGKLVCLWDSEVRSTTTTT
jgi:elongator complex protein 2